MSTWARPSDPSIYGWLELDVSRALAYLAQLERSGQVKVTLTHLVGKAVADALAQCPEANARVRCRSVQRRPSIDVFFQVAYEDGKNLSGTTIREVDRKSLNQVASELAERAQAIRQRRDHELARSDARLSRIPALFRGPIMRAVETAVYDWGLDLSRLGIPRDGFGSVMVTNVGMLGLPHGLAPLVPFSRVPIVVTVGSVHDAPVAEAGAVVVRPVMAIGVTLDHRVLDGYQAGKLASRFREIVLDPAATLGAEHGEA